MKTILLKGAIWSVPAAEVDQFILDQGGAEIIDLPLSEYHTKVGGVWKLSAANKILAKRDADRTIRNQRLTMADRAINKCIDAGLDITELCLYRQALRDMFSNPTTAPWPIKPADVDDVPLIPSLPYE